MAGDSPLKESFGHRWFYLLFQRININIILFQPHPVPAVMLSLVVMLSLSKHDLYDQNITLRQSSTSSESGNTVNASAQSRGCPISSVMSY